MPVLAIITAGQGRWICCRHRARVRAAAAPPAGGAILPPILSARAGARLRLTGQVPRGLVGAVVGSTIKPRLSSQPVRCSGLPPASRFPAQTRPVPGAVRCSALEVGTGA